MPSVSSIDRTDTGHTGLRLPTNDSVSSVGPFVPPSPSSCAPTPQPVGEPNLTSRGVRGLFTVLSLTLCDPSHLDGQVPLDTSDVLT